MVAPKALHFFYEFNKGIGHVAGMAGEGDDVTMWGIAEYAKFICQFVLLFGLCFELPVVVMALVKLDILSYKIMKGTRTWSGDRHRGTDVRHHRPIAGSADHAAHRGAPLLPL